MKIVNRLNLIIGTSFITIIILFAVILINSNTISKENRTHVLFDQIYKAIKELLDEYKKNK